MGSNGGGGGNRGGRVAGGGAPPAQLLPVAPTLVPRSISLMTNRELARQPLVDDRGRVGPREMELYIEQNRRIDRGQMRLREARRPTVRERTAFQQHNVGTLNEYERRTGRNYRGDHRLGYVSADGRVMNPLRGVTRTEVRTEIGDMGRRGMIISAVERWGPG